MKNEFLIEVDQKQQAMLESFNQNLKKKLQESLPLEVFKLVDEILKQNHEENKKRDKVIIQKLEQNSINQQSKIEQKLDADTAFISEDSRHFREDSNYGQILSPSRSNEGE